MTLVSPQFFAALAESTIYQQLTRPLEKGLLTTPVRSFVFCAEGARQRVVKKEWVVHHHSAAQ
jgi:hypothetical protein